MFDVGLLYNDVKIICGEGLDFYIKEFVFKDGELEWWDGLIEFFDKEVLVIVDVLFKLDGGLSVFDGNFGCGVIKILVFCMFYCNIKVLVVVFED